MEAKVRLTVVTGPHSGRKFCFAKDTDCLAGRGHDCFVQLSGDQRDAMISRHHCHIDIHAPCIQVEDLHSMNGTYLNGAKIEADTLNDGDLLTLGGTTLRVDMVQCPFEKSVWKEGDIAKRGCRMPCE